MREIDRKQKNESETAQETEPKVLAGDGIDRRNFLQCMAWAGTGLVWSLVAGVPDFEAAGRYDKCRKDEESRGLFVRADQRQSYRLQ